MTPLDLTIAIPVKNEEKNLPGCLLSIGKDLAQKIIIIDSGSTDNTKKIALDYGAEVLDFKWNGLFPKKRNWFLQNHTPKTKWVLFLDADEYLTENFKKELAGKLKKNDKVGYWLKYNIYFMSKKLKGGYPLKKLALFCVGAGEYEKIEENNWSRLDMEVHEHPLLKGPVGNFSSKIDHQDFRGVSHYVYKHSEYAAWEVNRFLKVIQHPEIISAWTWKQRLKYQMMSSVLIGPVFFFGSFFVLGGFIDGSRGFAFAIMKMSYFNQIYCKIREYKIAFKENSMQPR